jgi:hypothetical protein
LLLLVASGVSVAGGIVMAVFRPDTDAWVKLRILGANAITNWQISVFVLAVGLVLALRLLFAPDARGATLARTTLLSAGALGAVIASCAVIGVIGFIGESREFAEPTTPEIIGDILQFVGRGTFAAAIAVAALRARAAVPAPGRAAPAPAVAAPAVAGPGTPGWAGDPFGRHQWRYWDGTRWTDQVADGSTQSSDPAG